MLKNKKRKQKNWKQLGIGSLHKGKTTWFRDLCRNTKLSRNQRNNMSFYIYQVAKYYRVV